MDFVFLNILDMKRKLCSSHVEELKFLEFITVENCVKHLMIFISY